MTLPSNLNPTRTERRRVESGELEVGPEMDQLLFDHTLQCLLYSHMMDRATLYYPYEERRGTSKPI